MAITPPPKLYKYQPYNVQTLDNLKNRRIWFSKTISFNDPFDGSTGFNMKQITEAEWQDLMDYFRNKWPNGSDDFDRIHLTDGKPNENLKAKVLGGFTQARHNLINKLQGHGAACFSEKLDDVLMWAHYAEGDRGFCLEFDTKYPPFEKAQQIQYSNSYPEVNIASIILNGDKYKSLPLLTIKSEHWSYEKEWRLLHEEGNKEFGIDVAALTGIYLGCAMPFVHKEVIFLILKDSPTKFYEMQRSETEYKLTPIYTDYTPYDYSKSKPR